jgi:hypothetical protein
MSRKVAAVALLSTALCTGGIVALIALLGAVTLLPTRRRLLPGSPRSGW